MKKIIRIAAFALVAALMLCSFAGCKSKDDTAVSTENEYSASSSVQMTDAQAESLANSMTVKLYYPTSDKTGLVTESVLLEYTSKEKKTSKLVMSIIDNLISGPKNTASAGNLFPDGTEVESVKIQGGCAKISFNRTFGEKLNLSKEETALLVQSITNTATEVKDIDTVKIVCAGDEMGALSNGFDMNASFTRDQATVKGTAAETSADAYDDPYDEKYYMDVPLE
ncbi:MAG: GerMN domain-containing protein [Clostridia bacterium]|nr:GerMN domain-containing protein [Clostridia bacterium]